MRLKATPPTGFRAFCGRLTARRRRARAEEAIAEVEEEEDMRLCAEQREAVQAVEREGVLVITGGPGTGKTTTLKCILRLLDGMGGAELCALRAGRPSA